MSKEQKKVISKMDENKKKTEERLKNQKKDVEDKMKIVDKQVKAVETRIQEAELEIENEMIPKKLTEYFNISGLIGADLQFINV